MITTKERIARARVKRARLEKMRDKFLILSEDIGIKATDRLKALSMAYEIEKKLEHRQPYRSKLSNSCQWLMKSKKT